MDQIPAREKLLQIISENPGIHFREIQRISGMAVGQTEYHLYQLERSARVVIREDGKNRRYFLTDQGNPKEKKIILCLRNGYSAAVIHDLVKKNEVPLRQWEKGRKSRREKVMNTIKEMESDGIIARKIKDEETLIYLVDMESIMKVLRKYRKGFVQTLEENLLSLLDEP